MKLDDDFPEITDALLGVLYPHYQAPLPAMAVVQFHLDRGQADLVAGYTIPRETALETDPIDGEPCRFRTCYPMTLWPIELKAAGLSGPAVCRAGDEVHFLAQRPCCGCSCSASRNEMALLEVVDGLAAVLPARAIAARLRACTN